MSINLDGKRYVAVKDLAPGDVVRLISAQPVTIQRIEQLEHNRVIVSVQASAPWTDVWRVWLWRYSLLETIEWNSQHESGDTDAHDTQASEA